jgi:phage baseplate assembly protein W
MNDAEHFLGRGWSFPPRFSRSGAEIETVAGPQDIQESLAILFSTEPGERVMRSDYGCGLQPLVFAEMDQELVNMLRSRVTSAVLMHEPRIAPERVEVADDPDRPGVLLVSLTYSIRGSNSRYNLVFPFYQREAVAVLR